MNLFSLTTGVCFAILLTLKFEASIEIWFIGLLAGELLALPIVYYRFKNSAELSDDLIERFYLPILTSPLLRYCGPMVLTNLLIWSQMYAYRVITDLKLGSEMLSDLAVALGVALAIFAMVESVLNQFFYPELLRNIVNKKEKERVRLWLQIFEKAALVYFCVAVFVICGSQTLMIILTDAKFHDVYVLTSLAALIELGRVTNNIFLLLYQSEKKIEMTILPYLIGALSLLGSLLLFDIEATVLNVILSLIISHCSVTLFLVIKSTKEFNISFISLFSGINTKRLIALPIFLILAGAGHLSTNFSYHLVVLAVSLAILGYSVYPLLETRR